MHTLYSLGNTAISEDLLKRAFLARIDKIHEIDKTTDAFRRVTKRLTNSVLKGNVRQKCVSYSTCNPSVNDYLSYEISKNPLEMVEMTQCAISVEQIERIAKLSNDQLSKEAIIERMRRADFYSLECNNTFHSREERFLDLIEELDAWDVDFGDNGIVALNQILNASPYGHDAFSNFLFNLCQHEKSIVYGNAVPTILQKDNYLRYAKTLTPDGLNSLLQLIDANICGLHERFARKYHLSKLAVEIIGNKVTNDLYLSSIIENAVSTCCDHDQEGNRTLSRHARARCVKMVVNDTVEEIQQDIESILQDCDNFKNLILISDFKLKDIATSIPIDEYVDEELEGDSSARVAPRENRSEAEELQEIRLMFNSLKAQTATEKL